MKLNTDWLPPVLLILLALWIGWTVRGYPEFEDNHPGPGLFPGMIALLFFISGAGLMFSYFRSDRQSEKKQNLNTKPWRLAAGIGVVLIYPFLHQWIGAHLSIGIICISIGLLLGANLISALFTSGITVLLLYLIFNQALGVSI